MTNENGKRYSEELKAATLKRMMPPENESVKNLSEEMGISDVTLYKWSNEARNSGTAMPEIGKRVIAEAVKKSFSSSWRQ